MSDIEFVHLHCHSEYSVKNSIIRIPKLIEQAKINNMKSIAITDCGNLFAAVKFYKEAVKNDIKPIFGAELIVKDKERDYPILLLCQNYTGYVNLAELISFSYLQEQGVAGVSVTADELIKHNKGLIMISMPVVGDIAVKLMKKQLLAAQEKINLWQGIFVNRFYLAVRRVDSAVDENHLHLCVQLGLEMNIPIVATNDVQFLDQEDYQAHEARICIADGGQLDDARREKKYTKEQYLKSTAQMSELFVDLPELLTNSVEIAKRCNVKFDLGSEKYHLPDFPVPAGVSMVDFFIQEAKKGLEARFVKNSIANHEVYYERLEFELKIITDMDFSGYFLIVADFIRWSKENGIPVGPGRGSGAGSLVAYALNITNVDPLVYDLLFERFLNPERISMPDFDIDICSDRRDEVINYVAQKYGNDKVVQIVTHGTMAAKGVVRDVGRVLGHPYGFSDRISKIIPDELKITLDKALKDLEDGSSTELKQRYDSEESVATLIDLSKKLEGVVRNVGTHAGGVVIAPSKISNFCPVYKGANVDDRIVSQFDMDDVEAVGLVKFDFLGLSTLTIINNTIKIIESNNLSDKEIDIESLPLDDKKVYALLQRCDTTGVFQLESGGMRGYLKKLQADCFNDIVAMLALYRPGPLEAKMVDDYISVKHGAAVKYPHPMLEDILKPTNGVFVYQEQIMQSAQILAGYSLGDADVLRRAMGKKKAEDMEDQRSVFVKGAIKNNINKGKADKIFDVINEFSGYGFNKSHSVAYAYISYQTAWLKAHYPAAFMASLLSYQMDDTDKIAFTVGELKKMKLNIDAPSICESIYEFSIKDKSTVIYGLGAIKGVGEALVNTLVAERDKNGTYQDLFDFCLRIDRKSLNKRALEALIYSGACDVFGVDRASMIMTYPLAVKRAEQMQNDNLAGQNDLFAEADTDNHFNYLSCENISFKEKISFENSVMGYYFYNHPTDEYKNYIKHLGVTTPKNIIFRNGKNVRILAMIADVRYRNTKSGKQIASIIIEDGVKKINAVIFSKALNAVADKLTGDNVVVVSGNIEVDNFRGGWQLVVDKIHTVDELQLNHTKGIEIVLQTRHYSAIDKLINLLSKVKGRCPVRIKYQVDGLEGSMSLGSDYCINPSIDNIETIKSLLGVNTVNMIGKKRI